MSTGKCASQCCHASLGASRVAAERDAMSLLSWEESGEKIVCLGVGGAKELSELVARAREQGLIAYPIRDAGRTEVAPGTFTVAAFGPAKAATLNRLTGHLRLL